MAQKIMKFMIWMAKVKNDINQNKFEDADQTDRSVEKPENSLSE